MTKKILPKAPDFPSALQPVFHAPTSGQVANVIVFLPGLGDTAANFCGFAKALNLPETLCITIQPPSPLPVPLPAGFYWGDDIIFDQGTGSLEADPGFDRAGKLVSENVVDRILIEKCGFDHREILLFGYGQGGMVALAVAARMRSSLGGVISVGGTIPSSSMLVNQPKSTTPILLLGGRLGDLFKDNRNGVRKAQGSFEFVEAHEWSKNDDSMPKNRDEALPMMQFFARRLRSLKGVPSGSVELG